MWWEGQKNHDHFPPLYLLSFQETGTQGLPKPNGTCVFHGVWFSQFAYVFFGPT